MVGGQIIATSHPTCKNRVIDFFVVSDSMAGMVVGASVIGDALCRPHWPVRLYIKAGVRTMAVRMLKNTGKLPAILPHGPAWPHDDLGDISELTNEQRCELLMTRLPKGLVEEPAAPSTCRRTPWRMSKVGPGKRLLYREPGVAKQGGSEIC